MALSTGSKPDIVTTMYGSGWEQSTRLVDRRGISVWQFLRRAWRETRHADAFIVNGSLPAHLLYRDLLAGLVSGWHRNPPKLIIDTMTTEPGGRKLGPIFHRDRFAGRLLAKLVIKTLDSSRVTFCVLTKEEQRSFRKLCNIKGDVLFIPFYYRTNELPPPESERGNYVFAGGSSHRDYDLLVRAAKKIDAPIIIASYAFKPKIVPDNVTIVQMPREEYLRLEAHARVAVVPLQTNTIQSAGLQGYLNAMKTRVPVVVTEAKGVHDYIEHEKTGLIVQPNEDALANAVNRLLSDSALVQTLTDAAAVHVEQFSPERYRQRLLEAASSACRLNQHSMQQKQVQQPDSNSKEEPNMKPMGTISKWKNRVRSRLWHSPNVSELVEWGLTIGDDVDFGREVLIDRDFAWLISIGSHTVITPRVIILAHDSSMRRTLGYTKMAPVNIGSYVFIGAGAIILPGVTIGDRAIIGAGSIVTKSVTTGEVVAGNPAHVIGSVDEHLARNQEQLDEWMKAIADAGVFANDLHPRHAELFTKGDLQKHLEDKPGYVR